MKTRVFALLFFLCLNFSIISTAHASKYYYESYEQSEMYADAIIDDNSEGIENSNIIDIDQNNLKNKNSGSKIVVGEDKVNIKDINRINYNIRIKTRSGKKTDNGQSKTTKSTSSVKQRKQTEKVINTVENNKKVIKEEKSNNAIRNNRLNIYMSVGAGGFVYSKYETNTGEIRSSVTKLITDTSSLKELLESGASYVIDSSIGTKFFFLKRGTGPFVCFDFFFKYLIFASFSTNVMNSIKGVNYNTGVVSSAVNPSTTVGSKIYNSEYTNVLKGMFGFSFKGGFTIDRISFYGKINLGKLQVFNSVGLKQESITAMQKDLNEIEGSEAKQELSQQQSSLQNSESKTNLTTTYGAGIGLDINITKRFFLKLEYDHWWFKNTWTTDKYTNTDGGNEFTSEGNFGVITLGLGITFLGFSF